RPETDPVHRRSDGPGDGDPCRGPASARPLQGIRRLVSGDRGLQLRSRGSGEGRGTDRLRRLLGTPQRRVLPAETTNYVPIILAMTIMEKNAREYGIEGFQLESPLEYDTIETPGVTSLTLVADVLDIPPSELVEMNPSSLRGKVPECYPLHVPKGTA